MKKLTKKKLIEIIKEVDNLDISAYYHPKNKEKCPNYFRYIPFKWNGLHYFLDDKSKFSSFWFFSTIMKVSKGKKPKRVKFLDVGAGSGRVIKIAKELGFDVVGLEVITEVALQGRKIFDLSPDELIIGDAFDVVNKNFLADVDIIYTYMPIRNSATMNKLRNHLYENAKMGCILVEMLAEAYIENIPKNHDDYSYPYITRKTPAGEEYIDVS